MQNCMHRDALSRQMWDIFFKNVTKCTNICSRENPAWVCTSKWRKWSNVLTEITTSTILVLSPASAVTLSFVISMAITCSGKNVCVSPMYSTWNKYHLSGQGCHSISISKFPDFSLTFNHFPDPFGKPILAIFIHRLFEDSAQIFELADLIFKRKILNHKY